MRSHDKQLPVSTELQGRGGKTTRSPTIRAGQPRPEKPPLLVGDVLKEESKEQSKMTISSDTWAIVAATGLGPVFAVAITLWRERARAKYNQRLHVFRTLMATRRIGISPDHVNALNLVEVDFYKCGKVETAWGKYKAHLNMTGRPEDDAWREEKERLLAQLLFEIAAVLHFKIPALDIFKGGYAPGGWAHRDARAIGAMEFIYELSEGTKGLPVREFEGSGKGGTGTGGDARLGPPKK
jgi:hypothetical protein